MIYIYVYMRNNFSYSYVIHTYNLYDIKHATFANYTCIYIYIYTCIYTESGPLLTN